MRGREAKKMNEPSGGRDITGGEKKGQKFDPCNSCAGR